MTSQYQFFATTPKYTEGLLLTELIALGAEQPAETVGGVSFSGDLALAYRVCLWSRIANHVLLSLSTTRISSQEDLYDAVYAIDWSQHFDPVHTFAIDFFASQSVIQHTQYGAQKSKDAIVDQFRHHTGNRPSVDKKHAAIRINIHVKKNELTISLDLSGHSLHQRGYRQYPVAAPLKENLAAALLMRANWLTLLEQQTPLIDPMCGSGTLLIEAACMAANIAPGLFREDFGFLAWKQHDINCWQQLRTDTHAARRQDLNSMPLIMGMDHDPAAIRAAHANLYQAGLSDWIQLRQQEIKDFTNDGYGDCGLIICNPPYGERLSDNQRLLPVYETLGKQIKQHFTGWKASIITNDESLAKATGLHAKRINKLYNGNLLCNLYHFDIYGQTRPHEPKPITLEANIDVDLENRLRKNIKHLQKWRTKQAINCYRAYDADIPEYNFALDLYQSDRLYAVVQEYAAPSSIDPHKAQRRMITAIQTILHTLNIAPDQLFSKQRKRQSGTSQYNKLSDIQRLHVVTEANCRFYVNFQDYLDTGLFLDHRITRQLIQQLAAGTRFLNLFSYTGSASVYAAMGGARSTTSVDMSSTYLNWCRQNFELNAIDQQQHQFIKADCIEWIKHQRYSYDFIFVDPPTFSNSKSMDGVFDIQRDYIELLQECIRLLDGKGQILFSTNLRKFKFEADNFPLMAVEDISNRTIPPDFARHSKIHQCWLIRHANQTYEPVNI